MTLNTTVQIENNTMGVNAKEEIFLLRDQCRERPPVLKHRIHVFPTDGLSPKTMVTCLEKPHFRGPHEVVYQDTFHCTTFGSMDQESPLTGCLESKLRKKNWLNLLSLEHREENISVTQISLTLTWYFSLSRVLWSRNFAWNKCTSFTIFTALFISLFVFKYKFRFM